MNVLVLGANGATGRLVVDEAAAVGHAVTALVRVAASAKVGTARVVQGDATDGAAIAAALHGQEAVVSTLGVRNALTANHLIERSMSALVPAMERAGVRRLVVMSALGVGATFAQAPLLPRILYRVMLRDIFADKLAGEGIIEASRLEWTVAHPPLLTDGPVTGAYRAGETVALSGFPRIARADVARFMVAALGSGEWNRKHLIVTRWHHLRWIGPRSIAAIAAPGATTMQLQRRDDDHLS